MYVMGRVVEICPCPRLTYNFQRLARGPGNVHKNDELVLRGNGGFALAGLHKGVEVAPLHQLVLNVLVGRLGEHEEYDQEKEAGEWDQPWPKAGQRPAQGAHELGDGDG